MREAGDVLPSPDSPSEPSAAEEIEEKRERGELEADGWEFFQSTFREDGRIEKKMFSYDGGMGGEAPYSDGVRNLCIGM